MFMNSITPTASSCSDFERKLIVKFNLCYLYCLKCNLSHHKLNCSFLERIVFMKCNRSYHHVFKHYKFEPMQLSTYPTASMRREAYIRVEVDKSYPLVTKCWSTIQPSQPFISAAKHPAASIQRENTYLRFCKMYSIQQTIQPPISWILNPS